MSGYQNVITSLTVPKTLSAHMVSLGKIADATEDQTLKKLLVDLIRAIGYEHARAKHKSTPVTLVASTATELRTTIRYCEQALATKKPEWQILAEHHGWTPPTR